MSVAAMGIRKGDLIDLDEVRVQVVSEPYLTDNGHTLTFAVKQVSVTLCPECGSRNTSQWVESDDRYPAMLCQDCHVEWVPHD